MAEDVKEQQAILTEYFTKEVELHTNLLVSQRTKNNLVFCIGPFIVLGGLAASESAVLGLQNMPNTLFLFSCILALAAFLGLGYIGAEIEEKLWGQCNAWRRNIAKIHELEGNDEVAFEFSSRGLKVVYFSIFGIIGILFIFLLYLLKTAY